jgi:anthranilate synthase component 1
MPLRSRSTAKRSRDRKRAGGLVGVSGYDVVRLFEKLPVDTEKQAGIPDAAFVAPQSLLVFDHLTRRVALLHDGPEDERQRLRSEVIRQLRGPIPINHSEVSVSPADASLTKEEFSQRVEACKEHIAAGDIYQIVLSVLFKGRTNVAPFEVYRALRLLNPSPYMFFFDFDDLKVVGSSPEALVKLNDRKASLRPIAGTLPRGATRAEDEANEEALLADPKEAAEHVMLVDLARNDLGRVASAGSVEVDPYRAIERYSHVMHIVSGVQGDRPVCRELPRGHVGRRTQGSRDANHRGDGRGGAWSVCGYCRLFRAER